LSLSVRSRMRKRARTRSRARKQSRVGVLSPRSQILAPFPKTPVGPPKGAAGEGGGCDALDTTYQLSAGFSPAAIPSSKCHIFKVPGRHFGGFRGRRRDPRRAGGPPRAAQVHSAADSRVGGRPAGRP
jgi:hypothetical protein